MWVNTTRERPSTMLLPESSIRLNSTSPSSLFYLTMTRPISRRCSSGRSHIIKCPQCGKTLDEMAGRKPLSTS